MKKSIFITIGAVLLVALIVRFMVIDIIKVDEGSKCPQTMGLVLTNRWTYGMPWNTTAQAKQAKRGEWAEYHQPATKRGEKERAGEKQVGLIQAAPKDTLWYNNQTGEVSSTRKEGYCHPFVVPGKGIKLNITNDNIRFYAITIMLHEPVKASIIDDSLCVSGKMVGQYTFTQDYYWISSENRNNKMDSRSFGFIPQSSLIGRVIGGSEHEVESNARQR